MKPTSAEAIIRELAKSGAIDGKLTSEVAQMAGVKPAAALRALHALVEERFHADDGTELAYNDLGAENRTSGGPKSGGSQRNQIYWFFT